MSVPADNSVLDPVLSNDEVARLRCCGTLRQTTDGQVLYCPADECYDMVVILSGGVTAADSSGLRSVLFVQLAPGQFGVSARRMAGLGLLAAPPRSSR